jgi:hypothetical protein
MQFFLSFWWMDFLFIRLKYSLQYPDLKHSHSLTFLNVSMTKLLLLKI